MCTMHDTVAISVQSEAASLSDELWQLVVKWDSFSRDCVGASLVQSLDRCGVAISRYNEASHKLLERATLVDASLHLSEARYLLWRACERSLLTTHCCERLLKRMQLLSTSLHEIRESKLSDGASQV